jgi:hypothetical protein
LLVAERRSSQLRWPLAEKDGLAICAKEEEEGGKRKIEEE